MKILITGGAGFIGSHLAEHLLDSQHTLSIIDDLNSFYSPELKRQNLACIRQHGSYVFYNADIRDRDHMLQIVRSEQPDVIVHLAGRAGVRPSLENPLLYEEVNVRGTLTLLEAVRAVGVPKFIFASSSSIYGATPQVPFREDNYSVMPISPYAATKIAGEKLCFTYSHLYGISAICLRFFTVFGPRQRPDLAIRKFFESIENSTPIQVFGDGSSGRDYTFVNDIVSGITSTLSYSSQFDIFNLGNSHPVTLNMMISTIESVIGKKARIQYLPDQPGDVPITYADITKAKSLLGYEPATSFQAGIQSFAEWHQHVTIAA